jgi:RND family efflux transporter MFP subunit
MNQLPAGPRSSTPTRRRARSAALCLAGALTSCGRGTPPKDASAAITVGVTSVSKKTLGRELTVSSELVPFQEIDVYAKESGYVRELLVDYGTRVKKGQLLALLEIPELEVQLREDGAAVKNATNQVVRAEQDLARGEAQYKALHLQFERLDAVAKTKPGMVAQQEVDDSQGKDLAGEAQVEASKASVEAARSLLTAASAKMEHDQVLYDYSKITAPFAGVVTQRYANLGTLLQAGTNSSTQAMPLVRLSEDSLFRLVIPVPESYVQYIHVGDPVGVKVGSLGKTLPGKVARFSVDVKEDTRTMHTEVDVQNVDRILVPGMYAEATLTLERHDDALSVPVQAVSHEGDQAHAYVVTRAGRIEERAVTLGVQTASDAEVLTGLAEGDMVVVSDRSSLKPGQEVKAQRVEVMRYQGDKEN